MSVPLRRPALLGELAGGIRRSSITHQDGTMDDSTHVTWFQGISLYVDCRFPAERPSFGDVSCLADLARVEPAQSHWLARQVGFAGDCEQQDGLTTWHRIIDLQPPAVLPDVGKLHWEQDVLIERGELVDHVERWHPERVQTASVPSVFGTVLHDASSQRSAILVRVDDQFAFARGRTTALPVGSTLLQLLTAETSHDRRADLLDCEIALGVIDAGCWKIGLSTLPYREGTDLAVRIAGNCVTTADLTRDGAPTLTSWQVLRQEGVFAS